MKLNFCKLLVAMCEATRVGLEDNLYLEKGLEASSNAQFVEKAEKIIRLLGGGANWPQRKRRGPFLAFSPPGPEACF